MKTEWYEGLVKKSHDAYMEASQKAGDIDEISLMFDAHEDLRDFVKVAKFLGHWRSRSLEEQELVQGHDDPTVFTQPSRRYKTIYEFIHPAPYDGYRIEAMYVRGRSNIHEALFEWRGDSIVVAHASFKCRSKQDYADAFEVMSKSDIREFVAEYRNGYGQFSYFTADGLGFYLKPRINLRD